MCVCAIKTTQELRNAFTSICRGGRANQHAQANASAPGPVGHLVGARAKTGALFGDATRQIVSRGSWPEGELPPTQGTSHDIDQELQTEEDVIMGLSGSLSVVRSGSFIICPNIITFKCDRLQQRSSNSKRLYNSN